jgi:RNA polymerase sigma-70 factor, ECF subfamily
VGGAERYAFREPKSECALMAGEPAERHDGSKARRFKDIALPHLDDVYTLARYLLRSATDADDAVQECYLRAYRHFDTYRGPAIKPWLMAILRNVCHATRADGTRLVYTSGGDESDDARAVPIWSQERDTPEQAILRRHESDAMRRLIEQLPEEFREVVVLREIHEFTYREIAAIIDAPIGTVMSRLARGRLLLREAWIAAEGEGRST